MRPWRQLLPILFLLTACANPIPSSPVPATVTSTAPILTDSPTPLAPVSDFFTLKVRNAEYQPGAMAQPRDIQLTDGKYEEGTGTPNPISIVMTDYFAIGDLTGDKQDDAVTLVAENYGGTGSFVFLTVYENRNGTPVFIASTFIDDRPLIDSVAIEKGEIILDVIVHDLDDALCCPTFPTVRRYSLVANNLLMTSYSTQTPGGQPRTITVDSPSSGAEVAGITQVKGSITIAPFENNLVYRIYDSGGVEVVAGPVTVASSDLGAPGTFDQVINLTAFAGTTIRLVIQDVNAVDGSLFAMDSVILRVR